MINFNSQASQMFSTSINTQATNNGGKAEGGMTPAQASALAASISNVDPATLFNAGANRQTSYTEALQLID